MKQGLPDYREKLKEELEVRCNHNPHYSLRAFARDLGLSSSRLSEVINKKSGISVDRAHHIAHQLGYSEKETQHFSDLVEAAHARSSRVREAARLRLNRYEVPEYQTLQMDTFRLISDWYHYAILELTQVKGFKNDPTWIAKSLQISITEAEMAIERMVRLGIMELKKGKLIPKDDFTASPDGIPSESIRKFHSQILKKAEQALVLQSVEERSFSSITLSFDQTKMLEAKEKIKEFRRSFMNEFGGQGNISSVYCIAVQFFSLTQNQNKKEMS